MISNANFENHKDEVELLKNILFEKLNILEESPNFCLEIKIDPDVIEEPKLNFNIKFTLPDDYPNCGPNYEISDLSNYLASSKIKTFSENNIKTLIEENLGMPMMYQIYEMVKDFANEQEEQLVKESENERIMEEERKRKYDEKINLINKDLVETKTYTPVTKEAFEIWFKKYYAEVNKGKEKKLEQEARQSGREYFMNMKNLKDGTEDEEGEDVDYKLPVDEEQKDGTTVYFDADAFEENIDDIDFGEEGIDDD
jgi:hypothetical protein